MGSRLFKKQATMHQSASVSDFVQITNGTPQSTKLSCLPFVVLINKILTSFMSEYDSDFNKMIAFVDDMCVAEVVRY